MYNAGSVSKLIIFFTLRAVVRQTDVLLGKPRDFRAFKSSLGLTKESFSLFSKKKKNSYMRLTCVLHIELFYRFLCQCEVLMFLNFLNNLSRTLFSATSSSNHSCEFCFIRLDLIQ